MPGPRLRLIVLSALIILSLSTSAQLSFCGRPDNDLFLLLVKKGLVKGRYDSPETAVRQAAPGTGVLILASSYPRAGIDISQAVLQIAAAKNCRLYIE